MRRWFLISLILFSCTSAKFAGNFSLEKKPITYEKVKIAVKSQSFGSVNLNGYISIIQDSLICFKFYGPFSIDALSGVYADDGFKVRDNYNKILYPDFDRHIWQKSGLVINRKIVEYFLLARVSDLQNEIMKLNSEKFVINNSASRAMILSNVSNERVYRIEFALRKKTPSSILISYKDDFTSWSANIQNIYISNLTKKCKFGF